MLTIDKKVKAEIKRLEGHIFSCSIPVEHWNVRRCKYKEPGVYEDLEGESTWRIIEKGEHFGAPDVTAFLTNRVTIPKQMKGRKVALQLRIGGESCVFINDTPYNGLDTNRSLIYLTDCAQGNESYDVKIEAYSKDLIIESTKRFKVGLVITESNLVSIAQSVYDFYYDCSICAEYIEHCPEEYTRNRVLSLLYDAIRILDYSSEEALEKTAESASRHYHEGMKTFSGMKIPLDIYFVGHSHIDVAWHWPLKETVRKTSRTFSSMLRLMEQYPQFNFTQSMPVLYEMSKRYYPEVFQQVRKRINEGRWETVGSMYVEPDCNLINGESFIRQIIFGKRYYQNELGSDSNICFLPDVFGYSPAMPQILKKSGNVYFFTTKLTWNESNEFPYSVFNWKGLDGTVILSGMISMCTKKGLGLYSGDMTAAGIYKTMDYFKNKENDTPILYLYGHGDGGGGVTPEMLEVLKRMDEIPYTPHVKSSTVTEYFETLRKKGEDYYPTWTGELYFEKHRGTFTTAANNKKYNRKSEFLYRDAELLSSFARVYSGSFPKNSLEEGWELLLLNQFHDILPGTCVESVYEQTEKDYQRIKEIGDDAISRSVQVLSDNSDNCFTVFNTLSWARNDIVRVKADKDTHIADEDGNIPVQICTQDGYIEFLAENIPAMTGKRYEFRAGKLDSGNTLPGQSRLEVDNPFFKISINVNGEIEYLYDKSANRSVLKKGRAGNVFKLLDDIPVEWYSAWETTRMRDDRPSALFFTRSVSVEEDNALYTRIHLVKTVSASTIEQDILLYKNFPKIEFRTRVDWHESQKILRVQFPVDVNTSHARYDVAFGNIERPNHSSNSYDEAKFEVCGHKWGDVSNGNYGVALLNDCKYGYSIWDSDMELSLLRASDYPSPQRDEGVHTFTYWLYPHSGDIYTAKVAQVGYETNVPLLVLPGKLPEFSLIQTSLDNMIIDTVKKAEANNDIIVRVFETYNREGQGNLLFGFDAEYCEECDLLERKIAEVPVSNNEICFDLKPFEIKTFRVVPRT